MNQPWIYMYSPSQSLLPPPTPPYPNGSSQCTSPEHLSHASKLGWWSVSPLIIYMFQCCSLKTSHPCLLPQSPIAIKKNSFETILMRWMKLEPIIQSEVSQKDKDQYSILTHIYMEFRKMITITLYAKQKKSKHFLSMLRESIGALALWFSSIWLFLSCILSNEPVIVSKPLLNLWAILPRYQTQRRGHVNSQFIVGWSEVQETGNVQLASEVMAVLTELRPQPVGSAVILITVRIELTCRTVSWYLARWRIDWCGRKIPYTWCQKWYWKEFKKYWLVPGSNHLEGYQ